MGGCFSGHVTDTMQSHMYDLHRQSQANLAASQRKMVDWLASGADIRIANEENAKDHRKALEERIRHLESGMIILQEMLGLRNPDKEGYILLYSTRGTEGAALWKNMADGTMYWEAYSHYYKFDPIGFHTYGTPKYLRPIVNNKNPKTGVYADKHDRMVTRLLKEYSERND